MKKVREKLLKIIRVLFRVRLKRLQPAVGLCVEYAEPIYGRFCSFTSHLYEPYELITEDGFCHNCYSVKALTEEQLNEWLKREEERGN